MARIMLVHSGLTIVIEKECHPEQREGSLSTLICFDASLNFLSAKFIIFDA